MSFYLEFNKFVIKRKNRLHVLIAHLPLSSIFSKIMDRIASFYRITDLVPTATGYFPAVAATPAASPPLDLTATTMIPVKRKPEIEVVEQLNYIKDRILI